MSALACPKGHADRLYSAERLFAHFPIADDGSGGWDYTGGDSRVFDETAEPVNLWCDDCCEDFAWPPPAQDQGTTSSSPGRSYLVGLPVSINVHDDGTVTLTVHAEDIVEAVADDDNPEEGSDLAQQVADSATAGAALSATGTTSFTIHLTPKGA